jgi:hypothetical protein
MTAPSLLRATAAPGPTLVATLPARYLTIAGEGEPAGPEFRAAAHLLSAAMDELIAARSESGHLAARPPLEALYFAQEGGARRRWKLLHVIAWAVHPREIARMQRRLGELRIDERLVRVERLAEGRCLQVMRESGAQAPAASTTLARAARELGLTLTGPYHEIYLPAVHGERPGRKICRLRAAEPPPKRGQRPRRRGALPSGKGRRRSLQ